MVYPREAIPTRPCLLLPRRLLRSPQVRRGVRCILFVVDGVHTPLPAVRDRQRRLQVGGPGVVDAGIGTTKGACPFTGHKAMGGGSRNRKHTASTTS